MLPTRPQPVHSVSLECSTNRLALWVVALVVAIAALLPLAFDPTAIVLYIPAAFSPPKFKLLMWLSAALSAAVVGATVSGTRPARVPVLIPVLAFLGVSALSAFLSGNLARVLVGEAYRHDGLLSLIAGLLLFYAAARFLDSWARVRAVLAAMAVSASLVSLYGVLQHLGLDPITDWGIPWYDGTQRSFSTIGNPVFLAAYLTLSMGVTAALSFTSRSRWEKVLWLSALALMGACWLYTYSRGAMLGVGLALTILPWLSYCRMGTVRPLLLPVAVLALSIFAASQVDNAGASHRVMATDGDSALSAITRIYIWRDTIPVILERPLLGHGPDNFAEPFGRQEGKDLESMLFDVHEGEPQMVDKAHNELLQVAATTGLLGLAAYLWILASYFRSAYRCGGWITIALSGGVLAYVLQLQTAFSTITTSVTFWAILGLSVAVMRLERREADVGDLPVLPAAQEPREVLAVKNDDNV